LRRDLRASRSLRFEFDDLAVYKWFLGAANEAGLGELVGRIREGYEEETPGGGVHWLCFALAGTARTEALARRMGTDRNDKPCAFPMIETKGDGGFASIAPAGGVGSIATIAEAERDELWSLARSFSELEPPAEREEQPKSNGARRVRPADDFNVRADWREILESHGWESVREKGNATFWLQPGGYEVGWGASTNYGGHDLLHVWSTAAPPFQPDKSYTKFTAAALIEQGGDFRAAAIALEAEGYGERPTLVASAPAESLDEPARPLASVMSSPIEALPEPARSFVAAGAEAIGCPPDFIALPLLAFAGAIAGNSR
jgi:hypothetical protein